MKSLHLEWLVEWTHWGVGVAVIVDIPMVYIWIGPLCVGVAWWERGREGADTRA